MKVLIAMPSYSGMIPIEVMRAVLALKKPSYAFADITGTLCPDARNMLLETAIEHSFTHIFFIDDDNIVHPDSLNRLLELDKDIIGCVYPKRDGKGHVVLKRDKDKYIQYENDSHLQQVDAIGMGCTLIKLEVLKKMRDNYKHPFEYLTEPRKLGEDVTFCERAKSLGLEVWALNEFSTGHIGNKTIHY